VELLVVVVIIGIIAAVGIPQLRGAITRARAAEAVGDLQVLRVAVFTYLTDYGDWPPDAGVGEVPEGLADYLPDGWSMVRDGYELNYDNWTSVGSHRFIAVTVEVEDTDLGWRIYDMLGPNAWTDGNFKYTWVLEWLE
jgi:type II secretory pathway pseudopilin PulG